MFIILDKDEDRRAYQCVDAIDEYQCFLEAVYEDACNEDQAQMRQQCAATCGFCY